MLIRLYVKEEKLYSKLIIRIIDDDFNYLVKVMRRKIGDDLAVFNGLDGQWQAKIIVANKKECLIEVLKKTIQQYHPPKLTLAFAPVKNVRNSFIAAYATQLGVTNFQPLITRNTIVKEVNIRRFKANIKEACEQCQRLELPEIQDITTLNKFIKKLPKNAVLILCDERGKSAKAGEVLNKINYHKNQDEIVVFIGPEGGFSTEEFEQFYKLSQLHSISLGPRILKVDTAIISALTLIGEFLINE